MKKANNYWTKEKCLEAAKLFKHRSDFQKNNKGAYLKALRNNWLNEICVHMQPKAFEPKGGKPGVAAQNRIELSGQKFGKWTAITCLGKVNGRTLYSCVCECGKIGNVSSQALRKGLSTKCSSCSNQISAPVLAIADFIKNLGEHVEVGYKGFGFEIDIYVPKFNWFLEYDGNYWHSSALRATKALELKRYKKFKAANLSGMRIFEDQWLTEPDLIKSMIAHRLGHGSTLQTTPIFEICHNPAKYRQFCNDNHLDGYGRSAWAVVAKTDSGETLAFMGFRRYLAGQYKGQMELSRFCTNSAYNCYGYFGKMLKLAKKHIKENNLAKNIVSASDNCISDGKVYKHNGFVQTGSDSFNWYYYLHSKGLRMHRANGRKLKPPKISHEEYFKYPTEALQASSGFMALKKWGKLEPLHKIYGWGQKLWVLTIK